MNCYKGNRLQHQLILYATTGPSSVKSRNDPAVNLFAIGISFLLQISSMILIMTNYLLTMSHLKKRSNVSSPISRFAETNRTPIATN